MPHEPARPGGVAIPAVAAALLYAKPISAAETGRRNSINAPRKEDFANGGKLADRVEPSEDFSRK